MHSSSLCYSIGLGYINACSSDPVNLFRILTVGRVGRVSHLKSAYKHQGLLPQRASEASDRDSTLKHLAGAEISNRQQQV